jgi:hypothetical protein
MGKPNTFVSNQRNTKCLSVEVHPPERLKIIKDGRLMLPSIHEDVEEMELYSPHIASGSTEQDDTLEQQQSLLKLNVQLFLRGTPREMCLPGS